MKNNETAPQTIQLSLEEFEAQFELIENPFDKNTAWEGCAFETYGEEIEFVKHDNQKNKVWTVIEEDDERFIVSGMQHTNRLYFLISTAPVPETLEYIVPLKL